MLKHRIIPVLQLKNCQIVKSVRFSEYRVVGHPKVTARVFNNRDVDELILLNIDSVLDEDSLDSIESFLSECFMPVTFGGGITTLEEVEVLMSYGVDKVAVNSAVEDNVPLIKDIIVRYGSQACVISIDVKEVGGEYFVYSSKRKKNLSCSLESYISKVEKLNPCEILLTSIDREGTESGYDERLLRYVKTKTTLSVVINGGAKSEADCLNIINCGADALGVSSVFLYSEITPKSIKEVLRKNNIPVRK